MISTIAFIVFFLTYGISHFFPFEHRDVVLAIAALIVGLIALVDLF